MANKNRLCINKDEYQNGFLVESVKDDRLSQKAFITLQDAYSNKSLEHIALKLKFSNTLSIITPEYDTREDWFPIRNISFDKDNRIIEIDYGVKL